MIHELKIWPEYFNQVKTGNKTFEVRNNDRDFKRGDTLILREWDPQKIRYTGQSITKIAGFVLTGGEFGLKTGYAIISLKTAAAQQDLFTAISLKTAAAQQDLFTADINLRVKNVIDDKSRKDNPMVVAFGPGPDGAKCKSCVFCYVKRMSKRYTKCEERNRTIGRKYTESSQKNDHRQNYQACKYYVEEQKKDD